MEISPGDAGLDPERFAAFLAGLDVRGAGFGGEDHSDLRWGAALTRGGYRYDDTKEQRERHPEACIACDLPGDVGSLPGLGLDVGLHPVDTASRLIG